MARPRTERGDHGKVGTKQVDGRWRGWARYRDETGKLRMVERWAPTKTKAESAVRKALDERNDRPRSSSRSALRATSTLAEAWADYERETLVNLAPGSQRLYRLVWTRHIEPALGALTVAEVSEADAERLLNRVARTSGAGAAKTTRTVLLGVVERARKSRAVRVNVVKASDRPTTSRQRVSLRDKDRAFTKAERDSLRALEGETADLIAFLLGTGARLGEGCAVEWDALVMAGANAGEPAKGAAHIGATVAKDAAGHSARKGETKTAAGVRDVPMPPWLVERMLARRANAAGALAFPAPRAGGVRDLRSTDREIRRVLDGLGLTWATSHTFRRTRATDLLAAGLDPVQVARLMGHKRPSITLDVYGKSSAVAQSRAAEVD